MAIGENQQAPQLKFLITSYVTQLNKICANITLLQDYVVSVGLDGLQALDSPFTEQDATDFTNAVNYLNTIAALWYGTAAQMTPYNFQNQLAELIGPTPTP